MRDNDDNKGNSEETKKLIRTIAHELRNPLSVIDLKANLLKIKANKTAIDSATVIDFCESIIRSSSQVSDILEDLIFVVCKDYENALKKKCSFHEVINLAKEMVSYREGIDKIDFIFDTSNELVINCYRVQLTQVITNLINNSIDAIQEVEKKFIKISSELINDKIHILYSDSGTGLDPKVAKNIFNPFFTTKSDSGGSGVGLDIARKIIDRHNGTISHRPDFENTTFEIIIPA